GEHEAEGGEDDRRMPEARPPAGSRVAEPGQAGEHDRASAALPPEGGGQDQRAEQAGRQPGRVGEAEALERAHATFSPAAAGGTGCMRASSPSIIWRATARCRSASSRRAEPRANLTWSAAPARSRIGPARPC